MGDPIPKEKGAFGGNVAAHCEVMGHFTVSCTKAAELIEIPFRIKTRVGPLNHVFDGGADPPKGRGIFGRPGPLELSIFAVTDAATSMPCSLQSPITNGSCSMPGKCKLYSEKFSARAMRPIVREGFGGTAQRGRSLISTIALYTLDFDKLWNK